MEDQFFQQRSGPEAIRQGMEAIRQEIGKVIVGQDRMVELILIGLLCDGHLLIEGVPGVAKTLMAKMVARVVDAGFSRIQFTPDLMPSDVVGTSVFNTKTGEFQFRPGPVFSNIVLIDEINRAPAKTQAALFEVMEERQVTVDGTTHTMRSPFLILATQNPIEQEGTYRLPEAQLDRFLFKIDVQYPTLEEEIRILEAQQGRSQGELTATVQTVLTAAQLHRYRDDLKTIRVDPKLLGYIAGIVQETRRSSALYLGASPRASINILNAARAQAALRGRDFLTPEDIREMALPVLRHRVILTPEKEMEGITADEIVEQLLRAVEIPR
jgi:MoxR-like ATPase